MTNEDKFRILAANGLKVLVFGNPDFWRQYMKRFILSTLAITFLFLGLGSLVERTGAKFKSDDKALELIAKARAALGGDAAIKNIQSMTIAGRTTKTFKVDGAERTDSGETEIAM